MMTTETMTMTKKRLTVTLDTAEVEAIETITADMGSPSASAAVRRAVRELAAQIAMRRDRASRLPSIAP